MTTNRLEAFSDGVLAIIITIMVLEMKAPEGASWAELKQVLPKFVSYVLSFIYIGIYWNNHHHLFQAIEKVNGKLLWANLFLLFTLSLIPFTTAWMGENAFKNNPVVVYGINLLACAIAFVILEKTAIQYEGETSKLKIALGNKSKEIISAITYLLGTTLSFFEPIIGLLCYVAVAILWLIPDKRIEETLEKNRINMESYDNIIEALNGLRKQGYVEDFNLKENCIECRSGQFKVFHNQFEIDKTFRFEGDDSSPANSSILYAISSKKFGLKGTMINSYSIYSDDIADEMLDKLKFA